MNYLIIKDNIIDNIIVADSDTAAQLGAVAEYRGARIGDPYDSPTLDKLQAQVEGLDAGKANRGEVQAVWDSMSAAIEEGVNGIDGQ